MRSRLMKLAAITAPVVVAASLATAGSASAANTNYWCQNQYTLYSASTAWWLVYWDSNADGLVCIKTRNGNVWIQDDTIAY